MSINLEANLLWNTQRIRSCYALGRAKRNATRSEGRERTNKQSSFGRSKKAAWDAYEGGQLLLSLGRTNETKEPVIRWYSPPCLSWPNTRAAKKAGITFRTCTMNLTGSFIICLAIIADNVGAFIPPLQTSSSQQVYFEVVGESKMRPTTVVPVPTSARPAFSSILRAKEGEEEITVFDAGGSVSWADYKKQKPEEFKASELLHDTKLYKFASIKAGWGRRAISLGYPSTECFVGMLFTREMSRFTPDVLTLRIHTCSLASGAP